MSDLSDLNRQLNLKLYPMSKIREIILKLEDYKYVTLLDLSMRYYHINLSEESSDLCKIIQPLIKYS